MLKLNLYLILFFVLLASASAYSVNNNTIAYWQLDNKNDSSQNAIHLTNTSGVNFTSNGAYLNKTFWTQNYQARLRTLRVFMKNVSEDRGITISLYINSTRNLTHNGVIFTFEDPDSSGFQNGMTFYYKQTTKNMTMRYSLVGSSTQIEFPFSLINDSKYHQINITLKNGAQAIYSDKIRRNYKNQSALNLTYPLQDFAIGLKKDLIVGQAPENMQFFGRLDEFVIMNFSNENGGALPNVTSVSCNPNPSNISQNIACNITTIDDDCSTGKVNVTQPNGSIISPSVIADGCYYLFNTASTQNGVAGTYNITWWIYDLSQNRKNYTTSYIVNPATTSSSGGGGGSGWTYSVSKFELDKYLLNISVWKKPQNFSFKILNYGDTNKFNISCNSCDYIILNESDTTIQTKHNKSVLISIFPTAHKLNDFDRAFVIVTSGNLQKTLEIRMNYTLWQFLKELSKFILILLLTILVLFLLTIVRHIFDDKTANILWILIIVGAIYLLFRYLI